MKKDRSEHRSVLSENRRARHDYAILDEIECGIVLLGTEVKSLRHAAVSLAGAYAAVLGGELWLINADIPVYEYGNRFNHEPKRKRKLLVHAREVLLLKQRTEAKGLTLLPLKIYLKSGRIKVLIGVGRGKALYDKREDLKKKSLRRELGVG